MAAARDEESEFSLNFVTRIVARRRRTVPVSAHMSENFSFSSLGLPEAEGFRRYAELYGHGADVSRGSGEFRAQVRAWRLHGLIIYHRTLSGVIHSRAERVAKDGFTHFVISLVLEGRVTGGAASGFAVAEAGDAFIADTRRATRTEAHEARMITVSVARSVMEAALGSTNGLHGRLLTSPQNLMLADYLVSLVRRADALEPGAMPGLGRALIEILGSIQTSPRRSTAQSRRQTFSRRELVEQHIDASLADPHLSVDSVAADTGISRSALYRLFEQHGGVARQIRKRRLAALRSALDRRDAALPEVLARHYGFDDERQMERLFLEEFGQSASGYRQAVAAVEAGEPEDSRLRWRTWLSEVT
jgi:AraC-like DNA-binding protein